jgi:hypothetical protein
MKNLIEYYINSNEFLKLSLSICIYKLDDDLNTFTLNNLPMKYS